MSSFIRFSIIVSLMSFSLAASAEPLACFSEPPSSDESALDIGKVIIEKIAIEPATLRNPQPRLKIAGTYLKDEKTVRVPFERTLSMVDVGETDEGTAAMSILEEMSESKGVCGSLYKERLVFFFAYDQYDNVVSFEQLKRETQFTSDACHIEPTKTTIQYVRGC